MKWLLSSAFAIACSASSTPVDAGADAAIDAAIDAAKPCGATLTLDSACTAGAVCAGPTIAKQCDNTTAQVNGDCTCSGCDAGAGD